MVHLASGVAVDLQTKFKMIGLQYYGHRGGLCLLLFLVNLMLFLLLLSSDYTQSYVYTKPKPATIQDEKSSIKGPLLVSTSAEGPLLVLVLSSLPRSGSSLTGELLATIPNSVYYFEPIYKFFSNESSLPDQYILADYIKSLFTCEFEKEFEKWFKANYKWIKWWSLKAKRCTHMKTSQGRLKCISNLNIKQDCKESNAIIMKVIRARISWLEPFIIDQSLNLKIIHIVRDPRASIKSIMKFRSWNRNIKNRCDLLLQDLDAYMQLKDKYTNKIIRVTYEELSLEPFNSTQRIFQFLYDNVTLPESTSEYISSHMGYQGKKTGYWSLYKDSAAQYQDWRWTIPHRLLNQVEKEPACREAIQELGYTIFGSTDNVRNKSIPLMKENM